MKTFHYILTNRLPLRVSVGTKEMHSTSKIMKRYGPFALYLSVRSIPEDCPFKDAYHFTYNNNTGGFCTNPTSYAKSCASASKFRFHFKHCPDAAYTHDAGINQTLSLIHMLFNCNLILFFGQKVYASIVSPQCCCRHNKKGKVKSSLQICSLRHFPPQCSRLGSRMLCKLATGWSNFHVWKIHNGGFGSFTRCI